MASKRQPEQTGATPERDLMSAPTVLDPAVAVIEVVIQALGNVYNSSDVRFFAGGAPAVAAFNAHTDQAGCDEPFLWVRVMRRYRTKVLPNSEASSNGCLLPRAVDVEVGVARCAVVEQEPTWIDYETEAATSLRDSFLLETALRAAQCQLRADTYIAATSALTPFGPEGGVLGWTADIYAQFD